MVIVAFNLNKIAQDKDILYIKHNDRTVRHFSDRSENHDVDNMPKLCS